MPGALSSRIHWFINPDARKAESSSSATADFSEQAARRVRKFHQTLPKFEPTPVARLDNLARDLGVAAIRVKDESCRCGLNAFKVLGASFALSDYLTHKLAVDPEKATFHLLKSEKFKDAIDELTCITATGGNHGRAVTGAAHQLGCKAVVYLPKGSAAARMTSIRDLGAEADIIEGNYHDAVQLATEQARKNGWLLLQDTTGQGCELRGACYRVRG